MVDISFGTRARKHFIATGKMGWFFFWMSILIFMQLCFQKIFSNIFKKYLPLLHCTTDKETDESWDIFIDWKFNSGLVWAAGQYCEKKVCGRLWATFEACFFMFSWAKNKFRFFWKYCSVRSPWLEILIVNKTHAQLNKAKFCRN